MQRIFLVLLLASFFVLVYFLIKKAPELAELEEGPSNRRPNLFLKAKELVSKASFLRSISWNFILQKSLSKTRVALLKIENKIGNQLHFLRKNSKREK